MNGSSCGLCACMPTHITPYDLLCLFLLTPQCSLEKESSAKRHLLTRSFYRQEGPRRLCFLSIQKCIRIYNHSQHKTFSSKAFLHEEEIPCLQKIGKKTNEIIL